MFCGWFSLLPYTRTMNVPNSRVSHCRFIEDKIYELVYNLSTGPLHQSFRFVYLGTSAEDCGCWRKKGIETDKSLELTFLRLDTLTYVAKHDLICLAKLTSIRSEPSILKTLPIIKFTSGSSELFCFVTSVYVPSKWEQQREQQKAHVGNISISSHFLCTLPVLSVFRPPVALRAYHACWNVRGKHLSPKGDMFCSDELKKFEKALKGLTDTSSQKRNNIQSS